MRGIDVGDIFHRLVARTKVKQITKRVDVATAPFQHALRTKAGECVAQREHDPSRSSSEAWRSGVAWEPDVTGNTARLERSWNSHRGVRSAPFGEQEH